jgi:hypothetical protein
MSLGPSSTGVIVEYVSAIRPRPSPIVAVYSADYSLVQVHRQHDHRVSAAVF